MSLIKCVFATNPKDMDFSKIEKGDIGTKFWTNSKSVLLVDSATNLNDQLIKRAKISTLNSLKDCDVSKINKEFLFDQISLNINRQTNENCVVSGFFFILMKSKEEFMVCSYGSIEAEIKDKILNQEVINLPVKGNEFICISCNNFVVSAEISNRSIISRANNMLHQIYSKHKLNAIATTTFVSLGSFAHIQNQSMEIKKSIDAKHINMEALEHYTDSLMDQNAVLNNRINILEQIEDSDDENICYNTSEQKTSFLDEEALTENKDLKRKNLILTEEIDSIKTQLESKTTKVKNLTMSISKYEKILRSRGYELPLSADNSSNFLNWITSLQENENNTTEEISLLHEKIDELKSKIFDYENKICNLEQKNEKLASDNAIGVSDESLQSMLKERNRVLEIAVSKLQKQLAKNIEFLLKQESNVSATLLAEQSEAEIKFYNKI